MDNKLKLLTDKKQQLDAFRPLQPERENAVEVVPEQRFYTTDEVARLLKVDPESVRRYVRSHKLRAVKLGGKFIRIEKIDLDKFIEKLKT